LAESAQGLPAAAQDVIDGDSIDGAAFNRTALMPRRRGKPAPMVDLILANRDRLRVAATDASDVPRKLAQPIAEPGLRSVSDAMMMVVDTY